MSFLPLSAWGGNFYAGTSPSNVPWTNGIVPYEFTNTLTAAQQQTYLDGLREWELAANVTFVPHTSQPRWILFAYNTNGFDNVSAGYNPQVVSVSSLSRAQVGHEMGHSFGFTHENIRPDQTNYLTVLTNNIYNEPANIVWFTIDPASVTNGAYDFESVMHLSWDFASVQPGGLATQQPKPPYFPRYQFRMGNLALSPGDRAALRFLYGAPAVPLTNIVTTTADSGPGSLRAAMYYVADHPGAIVRFNLPTNDPGYSNGVFTIRLTGHLPVLATDGMVMDGSTQPGFTSQPLIVVDGSQIIPETFTSNSGLLIYSANNQIKDISFQGFNWNGLTLEFADATNNTIAGCWLGLDSTGSNAAPNTYQGILFASGASRNTIGGTSAAERNVISGNRQYGIWMSDTNTTGNVILGNYIGTDASGSVAVSNALGGIGLFTNGVGHVIGGTTDGARNVISGNGNAGIWLSGANVSNVAVRGNYIGLNAAGTAAVPNGFAGIYVLNGANGNTIGGASAGARNLISGNNQYEIYISDPGTSNNSVLGNFIGTDVAGTNAIGNGGNGFGIGIWNGARGNRIGGSSPGAGNLISGHSGFGYGIAMGGVNGNVIQGNLVGTDFSGTTALANGFAGVAMWGGSTDNLVGGVSAGTGNVISGNGTYGVYIADAGTTGNLVQGNTIGADSTGTNALGNAFANIVLQSGASANFIGGAGAGAANIIAFSGTGPGVVLYDAATTNNAIRGNSIYSNGALGIDLNNDGVTPNHNGFLAGPNDLQNFPVITNVFGYASSTIILGTLNSATDSSFFIDIYRNIAPDPGGYGEGQFYAGIVSVTTDGSGNATFALTNAFANYAGQYFTATATSSGGDTSEFGAEVVAANQSVPSALFNEPLVASTNGFIFALTLQTGFSYRIQATTNLGSNPIQWVDLTNFTATTPSLTFTDRTAANYGTRFYRVIS
ncbi:MAG TPA: M12 family metallopeptidase, partial [Verrucomicrobiae bacterium]